MTTRQPAGAAGNARTPGRQRPAARPWRRRGATPEKTAMRTRTAYLERVVAINRVAKVVKRRSAVQLHRPGRGRDGDGMVGVGYGKAKEVPGRDRQGRGGREEALLPGPAGSPAPSRTPCRARRRLAVVLLKPQPARAPASSSGGPVRAVLGVRRRARRAVRVAAGRRTPINVVHATVAALKSLNRPEEIAARRGLPHRGRRARRPCCRRRAAAATAAPGNS